MKVCIDCRAIRSGASGIGAFARSALEALAGGNGTGEFFVVAHESFSKELSLPPSFSVIPANDGGSLWGELKLPGLLEEKGVDAYFSPLFTCPVVRTACYIVTLHDVFPESHSDLCTPEFLGFWKRKIGPSLRSASHAIAISGWAEQMAVEKLGIDPERISIVHQWVGDEFQPIDRSETEPVLSRYGLEHGQYVLYVGAIDPRKNIERLVDAFGMMETEDLELAIAGQPSSSEYDLDRFVESKSNRSSVKLLGYLPAEDLPSLYSGARCFAFPSLAEGFGRPCIEAMACGVPVVASNATALPETCGNAALLPDPEDVLEIADALKEACFNKVTRKRLSEAGIERAKEFSAKRFAENLHTSFEMALSGPEEGLWPT